MEVTRHVIGYLYLCEWVGVQKYSNLCTEVPGRGVRLGRLVAQVLGSGLCAFSTTLYRQQAVLIRLVLEVSSTGAAGLCKHWHLLVLKLLYIASLSSLGSPAVVQDSGQSTVFGCACSTASRRLDRVCSYDHLVRIRPLARIVKVGVGSRSVRRTWIQVRPKHSPKPNCKAPRDYGHYGAIRAHSTASCPNVVTGTGKNGLN